MIMMSWVFWNADAVLGVVWSISTLVVQYTAGILFWQTFLSPKFISDIH